MSARFGQASQAFRSQNTPGFGRRQDDEDRKRGISRLSDDDEADVERQQAAAAARSGQTAGKEQKA